MNRGGGGYSSFPVRSSRPYLDSLHPNRPVAADGSSPDEKSLSSRDVMSHNRERNSQPNSRGGYWRYRGTPRGNVYQPKKPLEAGPSAPDFVHRPNKRGEDIISLMDGLQWDQNGPGCSSSGSNQSDPSLDSNSVDKGDSVSTPTRSGFKDMHTDVTAERLQVGSRGGAIAHLDRSLKLRIDPLQNQNDCLLPFQAGANDQPSQRTSPNNPPPGGEHSEQQAVEPFDICLHKTGTPFMLKPSLLVKNREKRNEIKRVTEGVDGKILRPGMVLLKNYLPMHDQVKIVKLCRNIGLGPGGFYQPVYHDGGKMHLKMMSLGRSWDPDRSEYLDHRPVDGAKAPIFPPYFHPLVEKAIKDSHDLIQRNHKSTCAENILPSLTPNICVVNFYSESGRLGLHQDKDESQDSLRKGLPVVSFSIGDSGEFLFGDQRDVEKAEKIILESGDVLIFGGKARHVFHGVSSIIPKTASPRPCLMKQIFVQAV